MTSNEVRTLSAKESLQLPPLVRALWEEARGDWSRAHEIAQDVDTPEGAWVHAYLHRREGDAANAAYWYRRARKAVASASFEDEWHAIVSDLLAP